MKRKKSLKRLISVLLTTLIIFGNVATSFAATGTIVNGKIVIRDGGTQFDGGTWVCQIDDGQRPLLNACCCEATNHTNPSNGEGVTLSKIGNSDIRARMAYVCYKYWNGASGNTQYSLSRACSIATGYLQYGEAGYHNRPQVEAFYDEARALSSAPAGFDAYIASPINGSQDQLAWRYNPVGYANLVKTANDTAGITGKFPDSYSLAGAEYWIYTNRNLTKWLPTPLTTDANGKTNTVSLNAGTYYVKEYKAPKGYALDSNVYTLTVTAGNTTTLRVSDVPLKGYAKLKKEIAKDNHLVAECPENYSLEGAEYEVYNADNNKIVGKLITDENGDTEALTLPAGMKVYAKEIKAPKGYRLNKTPTNTVIIENGKTARLNHADEPVFDPLNIKVTKKPVPGSDKNLPIEGAEYTIRYYKELKVNGEKITTEEQLQGLKPYRTWVFKTDKNGIASIKNTKINGEYVWFIPEKSDPLFLTESGKLAGLHGTYAIEETLAPAGFAKTDKVWVQQASFDSHLQEIITQLEDITDNEKPQTVSITINKVDAETGKPVPQGYGSLAGAIYEVSHYDAILGKSVVDGKITTDENGKGTLENLKPGIYKVKEIKAPKGYVTNKEVVEVKAGIKEVNTANFDYVVKSEETPHTTEISKYYLTGKDKKPLKGAVLQILDAKNKVVEEFTTTDKDYIIKGLPDGKYTLHEVKAPAGFVKAEDVTFEIKEGVVKNKVEMKDDYTKLQLLKVDIETGKPLSGAKLQILDLTGNVIKEWTSSDKPVQFDQLPQGEYILHEVEAPAGYVKAEDVKFTLKDTAEVQKIMMKDDYIKVDLSKRMITGDDELPGATLQLLDKAGKVIDEWVSTNKPYRIDRLPAGEYVLRETIPAEGFVTAQDVPFTVTETGKVQTVVMRDEITKVDISKVDKFTGDFVEGAELTIYPLDKDGKPVLGEAFTTFITEGKPHRVEGLAIGKYVLRENLNGAAELGYVTAQDVIFEVKDTPEVQAVVMEDDHTRAVFKKVDTKGNPIAGATLSIVPINEETGKPMYGETFSTWLTEVDNPETEEDESLMSLEYLPIGKYLLIENSAPKNYVKAKPVEFEVKDTPEVQHFEMVDKQVTALKLDKETGKPLTGATLQVLDEEGNLVDEWISGKDAHFISGLIEGSEYTLTEKDVPEGYVKAEDIKFTVDEKKQDMSLIMEDDIIKVEITKVDKDTGKPLAGATLQVLDKDGKVVDEWVSTDKPHRLDRLPEGEYTLHEVKAPEGYSLAKDQTFTVKETGEVQCFTLSNELIPAVPKTGDSTLFFPYLLLMLFASGMLIEMKRRKERQL